jgi:hypothetical protein
VYTNGYVYISFDIDNENVWSNNEKLPVTPTFRSKQQVLILYIHIYIYT